MTARAAAVAELIRTALAAADRLDATERDAIYTALVAALRSRRPESVPPLGVLPPPGETVRDPRGMRGGR